ncbi:uncharacterized protein MONOS_12891 [Monocercomonoides exilis]|uniref:uncharacterized protein n=1 Tax=Monocercomonoides exilis TaxID=2049356 RepID=UPI00355A1FA5|nr:hypothetical protein MONOS_12891 [Monocercomonoides exilis]|eukprot:MONOS_12891.1-p1 / transcript=MONOS_12891.1 / gene=MONOS_12891 / organism=Monocercomonoides_exilis_PA203 / gene_product=unspecified product / transcript_product=unspecified product / location=Mono_scaffold00747:10199-10618(-) / protein_length=140 / sequence_SO=supercontig / SO=protein_coding / is_pseudo=false
MQVKRLISNGVEPVWKRKQERLMLENEVADGKDSFDGDRVRRMLTQGEGRSSSQNSKGSKEIGCQISQQPVLHSQEERKIPPSLGLRPSEFSVKDTHFKMEDLCTFEKLKKKEDFSTLPDTFKAQFKIPVSEIFIPFLS